VVLPEPKSFFEQLFGDSSATTDLESLSARGFCYLTADKAVAAVALGAGFALDAVRGTIEVVPLFSEKDMEE